MLYFLTGYTLCIHEAKKNAEKNRRGTKMSINRFRDKEWETIQEPFQMAPQVYYVGTSYVGTYLIDTKEGLILIDQAFAESAYLIMESIRKLGFDPRNIKKLLVSHGHFDHCGGTRLFKEYTNAPVYMAKEDDEMKNEHPLWVHFGYENWIDFDVDVHYAGNKPIQLGNISIRTVFSPGHTPGTTSFFFKVKDNNNKTFTCGLHGGIGTNTLIPEFYKEHPDWPKDMCQKFIDSIDRMINEEVDILLPSHPNQFPILDKAGRYDEADNPFVDRTGWKALLSKRREMASKLL
jgi:metallo-beta-lactamase class B